MMYIYRILLSISLSVFDSTTRPLTNMGTNDFFCAKLCQNFHTSMRVNIGNMLMHIFVFMPIGIFIDPFFDSGRPKTHDANKVYIQERQ